MLNKAQALTEVEHCVPVSKIAADLKVSRKVFFKLIKAAKCLPKGTLRKRNIGSGKKRKTLGRTDRRLKQEQEVLLLRIISIGGLNNGKK